MIEVMAGSVCHDAAINGPPGQIQIANEIQNLVPDAFVCESELVVDWTFRRDDQQVTRGQVMPQAAHSQLLGFALEDECSRGRHLVLEVIHPKMKRKHLPADRWGGFKVVKNLQ